MTGHRNDFGVKDMADLYRTVGGVRYVWHPAPATNERIAAYRSEGVRCRRFRIDGHPEIFIHPDDDALVVKIDAADPRSGQ